jgi:hypothetical protein
MKRSEKLYTEARHILLLSLFAFSASVCVGVWSVRAWLEHPFAGLLVGTIALIGLIVTCGLGVECCRLFNLAEREWKLEILKSIRHRI